MGTVTPNWCTVLCSRVDRDRAAVRSVLAPVPQPEPASRLISATRVVSFLRNASRW